MHAHIHMHTCMHINARVCTHTHTHTNHSCTAEGPIYTDWFWPFVCSSSTLGKVSVLWILCCMYLHLTLSLSPFLLCVIHLSVSLPVSVPLLVSFFFLFSLFLSLSLPLSYSLFIPCPCVFHPLVFPSLSPLSPYGLFSLSSFLS